VSLTQYRGDYITLPELKMTTLPLGCVDTIREAEQCSCYTVQMLEEKRKITTPKTVILLIVLYRCNTQSLTVMKGMSFN